MARSIGEILPGIIERCAEMVGIQYILSKMDTDQGQRERKRQLRESR